MLIDLVANKKRCCCRRHLQPSNIPPVSRLRVIQQILQGSVVVSVDTVLGSGSILPLLLWALGRTAGSTTTRLSRFGVD